MASAGNYVGTLGNGPAAVHDAGRFGWQGVVANARRLAYGHGAAVAGNAAGLVAALII
jgi:hypothetical protein